MEKLHAIYPGAFKPFHDGHFLQISKYLNNEEYDTDVTIIISSAEREGITPETTKNFIDKVLGNNKFIKIIISEFPSPIKSMYNIIENGEGLYTMISSTKGQDDKRVEELKKYYKKGSKHYKENITIIDPPVDLSPIVYDNRIDNNADKEISSTIVRNDVRNNDFESFKTSYKNILEEGAVNDKDLLKYFNELKKELLPYKNSTLYDNKLVESYFNNINYYNPLNEGGMAGHMSHPYEIDEFTFKDLKELNNDIFNAKIEHITEKLDGQNLFASVNRKGQTVFARNMSDMKGEGMSISDMAEKWKDLPHVANSFTTAGAIIDKVFRNIKDRTVWFNRDRSNNRYKLWVNCEIINSGSTNVIPYNNNCVYFHEIKCYQILENGLECFNLLKNAIDKKDMDILKEASDKVQHSSLTNEIIIKQLGSNSSIIEQFNSKLDDIIDIYDLLESSTLREWKSKALQKQIQKQGDSLYSIMYKSKDLQDLLEKRWIEGSKETNMKDIKLLAADIMKEYGYSKVDIKGILDLITKYDKEYIAPIMKKILKPLDQYFIDLGNEVIKRCKGFNNDGNELSIIFKLKNEIKEIIQEVKKDNDPEMMRKLREQLSRLKETGDKVNATEGIVLKFKGRTIKLTGSFAAVNQILGLKKYSR